MKDKLLFGFMFWSSEFWDPEKIDIDMVSDPGPPERADLVDLFEDPPPKEEEDLLPLPPKPWRKRIK